MYETICKALLDRHGQRSRQVQYVSQWTAKRGLDVVVETRNSTGRVWMPYGGRCPFSFTRYVPPTERVNADVYAAPSLRNGDLLEFRIESQDHLLLLLGYIEGRMG